MGCVSSKHVKKELSREISLNNGGGGGGGGHHVVSLTSTTYGHLKLDNDQQQEQKPEPEPEPTRNVVSEKKKSKGSPREEPEIINTWELMKDLDEDGMAVSKKLSPKSRVSFGKSRMSPLKLLDKIDSPKKGKRFGGKENSRSVDYGSVCKENRGFSPKQVLKPKNILETPEKGFSRLSFSRKTEDSVSSCRRSKSFSPLFDPELVASYERELFDEKEQIKMVITPFTETRKPSKTQESRQILENFERNCPPRGENSVVIYTTTLRGIRKTFEECNTVRSILESHQIKLLERDVSMHSAFKDELNGITGSKKSKLPVVFIKGRLIGGVDEIVRLEEEGKLELVLDGIPNECSRDCKRCGGMRFMMCVKCNGSCKVRDEEEEDGEKCVKCGECNENGLIICPNCC